MAKTERLICHSADLINASAGVRFEIEREGKILPAFVVRHEGKVYAYQNRCGHIPVELDWIPGAFFDHYGLYLICATHGANYEASTGRCVDGPCRGTGLIPIAVVEKEGGVYLKQCEKSE